MATTLKGKLVQNSYKARQLKKPGLVITGRGMTPIFDSIEEYANEMDLKGFDEYLEYWPGIVQRAMESFFLMCMKRNKLPGGQNIDDAIDSFSDLGRMETRGVVIDLFIVGYSRKHKTMGVAIMQTYRQGQRWLVQESYQPGLFFFLRMEPIIAMIKKKGRMIKTDKDMIEGLRLVAKYEHYEIMKKNDPGKNLVAAGGDIQKTTIYKNGTFNVKTVAPFYKSKKENPYFKVA